MAAILSASTFGCALELLESGFGAAARTFTFARVRSAIFFASVGCSVVLPSPYMSTANAT